LSKLLDGVEINAPVDVPRQRLSVAQATVYLVEIETIAWLASNNQNVRFTHAPSIKSKRVAPPPLSNMP
jgi:hypothetical protein